MGSSDQRIGNYVKGMIGTEQEEAEAGRSENADDGTGPYGFYGSGSDESTDSNSRHRLSGRTE